MTKVINTILGLLVCLGIPVLAWLKIAPKQGPWLGLLFALAVAAICILILIVIQVVLKTSASSADKKEGVKRDRD